MNSAASHALPSTAQTASPENEERPLARGLRLALGVVVVLAAALAGSEVAWRGPSAAGLFFVEFSQVVVILSVLGWLRQPNSSNRLIIVGIGACVVIYLTSASMGMLGGGPLGGPLVFSALALAIAVLLPWGVRPQLFTVSVAGLAVLFQVLWLYRGPGAASHAGAALAATAVVLLASLAVAWQIDVYRRRSLRDRRLWLETEQALQNMYTEIEQRVNDRTANLEATNQDLESFSYSVSHDLRAPLRSISGFAKLLMEDYGEQLDPRAVEMIERVRAATRRMSELVEGLLEISRANSEPIAQESIDLAPIAAEIAEELAAAEPERHVTFKVPASVPAVGDARLVRALLSNLLSNAWKFTGGEPAARVDIGTSEDGGERVFFVRDNGVGFKSEHAPRLFVPFQRFHPQFEGTGIGLATAARIVGRHGGRIWAQGEPDKGATIYFTLTA